MREDLLSSLQGGSEAELCSLSTILSTFKWMSSSLSSPPTARAFLCPSVSIVVPLLSKHVSLTSAQSVMPLKLFCFCFGGSSRPVRGRLGLCQDLNRLDWLGGLLPALSIDWRALKACDSKIWRRMKPTNPGVEQIMRVTFICTRLGRLFMSP